MAADTIVESIELMVESEKRKGQGGKEFNTLIVKHNGKIWTVGKKSADSVKEGETYNFNLQKSEWKDKIYYWANLNNSDEKPKKENNIENGTACEITNTRVVEYFKKLTLQKKLRMLQYLIGILGEE